MFNPFSLEGKKIVITGASSGIGRQCAIDCSKMGARIVLIGRNMPRLEETLSEMSGNDHEILPLDINDKEMVKAAITNIIERIGPIDGFVHSAGIEKTLPLRNVSFTELQNIFNTNFFSAIELLKLFTKKKNYNEGFKVVFIASITAIIARAGTLAYTASKGALVAATRELAIEFAPKSINVNCISPGTILTPMMQSYLDGLSDESREKRISGFPLGLGKPEDIANGVIYLLSDASRWITGQNLVIDGGYTVI